MDYFAHGLWSYIFFHRIKKVKLAIFFGLLPDSLSWLIYLIYSLFTGLNFRPPVLEQIPNWVFVLYGLSHSLVIFSIVALLILLIYKKIPVYLYAWPIAIVIDIFSHKAEFLPAPFLWPVSSFVLDGISWANPLFLILNYFLIVSAIIYLKIKSKNEKETYTK